MPSEKAPQATNKGDEIVADARRNRQLREKTYREQALKLFPKVCAHCGREFEGKRLRELTVHHKDHNHDNNPTDGSNWELLCLYCHENVHSRYTNAEWYGEETPGSEEESAGTYRPFTGLEDLLKSKPEEEKG